MSSAGVSSSEPSGTQRATTVGHQSVAGDSQPPPPGQQQVAVSGGRRRQAATRQQRTRRRHSQHFTTRTPLTHGRSKRRRLAEVTRAVVHTAGHGTASGPRHGRAHTHTTSERRGGEGRDTTGLLQAGPLVVLFSPGALWGGGGGPSAATRFDQADQER